MKKINAYTFIEASFIIIMLSLVLALFTNIKFNSENKRIKEFIKEVNGYTSSIKDFKRKYGFLPGDLKKTEIFELSINNTDGNENGLIEDKNQQNNINNKNIQLNGEIPNFWLHLYNSDFLKTRDKNIFPYIKFLNTGILVFSNKNKNYYHFAVLGINKNKEIETINNLTPYQAYIIDKKIDDASPFSGKITVFTKSKINNETNKKKQNCATEFEYLTNHKKKSCQLIMEIDI